MAVLLGGTGPEHEVSICSGRNVIEALPRSRYEVTPVFIDRLGCWRFGELPAAPDLEKKDSTAGDPSAPGPSSEPPVDDVIIVGETHETEETSRAAASGVLERLRAELFDVVFVALHGAGGEDGTVQGLLEVAAIPYTGSGVLASALAMDKRLSKELCAAAGLEVAEHVLVDGRGAPTKAQLDRAGAFVAATGGCVVKPIRGGSSCATIRVRDASALPEALEAALADGGGALVEELIESREGMDVTEVTCGVLDDPSDGFPNPLPVTEIVPKQGEFFDFRAKYTAGACEEITPARISNEAADRVQRDALKAHQRLGCEGMSRSDFMLHGERPIYLETNTIPGMTRTSLLPQGAAAAGIEFSMLIENIIAAALARPSRRLAGEE